MAKYDSRTKTGIGVISNVRTILQSRGIRIDERKSKGDYLILCPFHDDKNASCSINKEKGFFYCWACGEKGSVAKLVGKLDGISEKEAWKLLNGEETGGIVIHSQKESSTEKWKPDPLDEKYYEVKDLMLILLSRRDLRLAKELNVELLGEDIWEKFREKQKEMKNELTAEHSFKEAKFEYITNYLESYHKDKLYFEFVNMIKEYHFDKEFSIVLELLENERYKNYKTEKQILKELHFSMYRKIKGKLNDRIDEIFQ